MQRPSPALLVSALALVVALGGTGYAAVAITGKDVKNGSLTGKDVKNRSLKAEDFKTGELQPGPAGQDAPPLEAVTFVNAAPAAVNSCVVGGFCSSYYGNHWGNYGAPYAPVGFYKDRSGLVHLYGVAKAVVIINDIEITGMFILPPAYRPAQSRVIGTRVDAGGSVLGTPGYPCQCVTIDPSGVVSVPNASTVNPSLVALDGIVFRP
jgi:hypothetical protein